MPSSLTNNAREKNKREREVVNVISSSIIMYEGLFLILIK